jgi:hypothetical protein
VESATHDKAKIPYQLHGGRIASSVLQVRSGSKAERLLPSKSRQSPSPHVADVPRGDIAVRFSTTV